MELCPKGSDDVQADHTAWFTWKAKIKYKNNNTWVVRGTLDRDIADYSDWHGAPYDYDGDGDTECPGGICYKTASVPLPQDKGTITIPDDWMARLVVGGTASNPGFGIYYNTREWFYTRTDNWSVLPNLNYYWMSSGSWLREPKHELEAPY